MPIWAFLTVSTLAACVNFSLTITCHNVLTIHFQAFDDFDDNEIMLFSLRFLYIAELGLDDVVECGICDFMHPAMTLPDAMISKAIRLGESVERVEVVLNYF